MRRRCATGRRCARRRRRACHGDRCARRTGRPRSTATRTATGGRKRRSTGGNVGAPLRSGPAAPRVASAVSAEPDRHRLARRLTHSGLRDLVAPHLEAVGPCVSSSAGDPQRVSPTSADRRAVSVATTSADGTARSSSEVLDHPAGRRIDLDVDDVDRGGGRMRFEIEHQQRAQHARIAHRHRQLQRPGCASSDRRAADPAGSPPRRDPHAPAPPPADRAAARARTTAAPACRAAIRAPSARRSAARRDPAPAARDRAPARAAAGAALLPHARRQLAGVERRERADRRHAPAARHVEGALVPLPRRVLPGARRRPQQRRPRRLGDQLLQVHQRQARQRRRGDPTAPRSARRTPASAASTRSWSARSPPARPAHTPRRHGPAPRQSPPVPRAAARARRRRRPRSRVPGAASAARTRARARRPPGSDARRGGRRTRGSSFRVQGSGFRFKVQGSGFTERAVMRRACSVIALRRRARCEAPAR